MEKARYGAGMFILRGEAEQDLFAVLDKLAGIGFDGVELMGFFGRSPREIRKKMDDLGMQAFGDHVSIEIFAADTNKTIDDHLEAGCGYITVSHREGQFTPGTAAYDAMLCDMRRITEKCLAAGITPQYHNHGCDVRAPSYTDSLLTRLASCGPCLEPDLGWMEYSSIDPADYLRRYRAHCRVLHFKDVYAQDYSQVKKQPGVVKRDPGNGGFEFRPTGYGTVNFPRLMPLCFACAPEWMVIDHDLAYERDTYGDLRVSLEYMRTLVSISA